MTVKERINALDQLGKVLSKWILEIENKEISVLDSPIESAFHHNGWFDKSQVLFALKEVNAWLNYSDLTDWTKSYDFDSIKEGKKVGVIMAGNIPLVGFHDYLSVLISGHKLQAKVSKKDQVLIKFIHQSLVEIDSRFESQVEFSEERFLGLDGVIATGSDNSARYFDYYFSKTPHIIRKNRTSVAVLNGNESAEELALLANDIFRYYGLGCRNVTKVYFPKGFDVDWFYKGIIDHGGIINSHKYQNNYDYHKSVFLLNGDKLWDNNFLLLKRDDSLSSPVGTLFYEEYDDLNILEKQLAELDSQIQCRVGKGGFSLGEAQKPKLDDYSDNINVLDFLSHL